MKHRLPAPPAHGAPIRPASTVAMSAVERHPSDLRIAPLHPDDMPRVMTIQAACYTSIVPESATAMEARRQSSPDTCLGAWCAGELIGYLLTLPVRWPDLPALDSTEVLRPEGPDTLYLHDLALSPHARGLGAASRLVHTALGAGRARGLPFAALVAIQGSEAFWRRHAFATVPAPHAQVQAKLDGYGADARLMRRCLGEGRTIS